MTPPAEKKPSTTVRPSPPSRARDPNRSGRRTGTLHSALSRTPPSVGSRAREVPPPHEVNRPGWQEGAQAPTPRATRAYARVGAWRSALQVADCWPTACAAWILSGVSHPRVALLRNKGSRKGASERCRVCRLAVRHCRCRCAVTLLPAVELLRGAPGGQQRVDHHRVADCAWGRQRGLAPAAVGPRQRGPRPGSPHR